MNAIELFHATGKPAGIFHCEKCRIVHRTREEAEQCCQPVKCAHCGKDVDRKYYFSCSARQAERELKREAERFAKAEKLESWDGWVYCDWASDDYYPGVGDLLEWWEENHEEGDELPRYVWACKPVHFAVVDVRRLIEPILEDAYEDFDSSHLKGVAELKAAVEAFNEANKDIVSYEPDYTKAVLLPTK